MTSTQNLNLEAINVGDTVAVTWQGTSHEAIVTEANDKRVKVEGDWYYRATGKATKYRTTSTISA